MKILFTYILLLVLFYSCEDKPVVYTYKQTIVKAKTIDLYDGNTRYNIAFTNGKSESFSFGLYSKYEVGDTVCWKKEQGYFWKVTNCK